MAADRPPLTPLPDPLPGSVIDGVTLVRRIGEGGFGVVYEGRQTSEPFVVAVKVMRPHVATPGLVRRFEYEAETLSRLDHPGIARFLRLAHTVVHDVTVPCIVMELVPAAKPITKHVGDLRLPTHDRIELLLAAAEAIGHGHAHGVLHRDVKPGNILVGADGRPKVIDYGWARGDDSAAALQSAHTHVGVVFGTFQYMSPEQFDGDPAAVDIRSDVYALGAILQELLTGKPPIENPGGPLFHFANRVREEPPAPLPADDRDIDRRLRSIVARCLEKDKARRYSSATELAADLRRYLAGEPIAQASPALVDTLAYLARKHAVAAAAAALAVAALAAAAATSTAFYLRSEAARAREREMLSKLEEERGRANAEASRAGDEAANARRQLAVANLYRLASAIDSADSRRATALFDGTAALVAPGAAPDTDDLPVELACLRARLFQPLGILGPEDGATPNANVRAVAVDDAATRIVTGAADGTIRLWDADGYAPLGALPAGTGLKRVVPLPGTTRIATADDDVTLRLWDARDGTARREVDCGAAVRDIALSRDGRHIVAGTVAGKVVVVPLDDAESIRSFPAHDRAINAIVLADGDELLATASVDGTTRLWSMLDGTPLESLAAGPEPVACVAASADGTRLACVGPRGTIRLLDAATREREILLDGSAGTPRLLAFSPDGRLLAASGDRGTALWETSDGRRIALLAGERGRVLALAFAPDSRTLATASSDRSVRLWRTRDGAAVRTLVGHHDRVESLAWFPDGSRLVSGSADGTASVWATSPPEGPATLRGHDGPVGGVCFLPRGPSVVSWSDDGSLRRWDARTGRAEWTGPRRRGTIRKAAPSPDGALVAVAGDDHRILLHDARDGSVVGRLEGHGKRVLDITFAPSGRLLASASDDHDIRLWDPASEGASRVLSGHAGGVLAVAFSPDGARLASASRDASARLWDAASDGAPTILAGHGKLVRAVTWSPDGSLVATASDDGTARLWRALDGVALHTLRAGTSQVTAVAFDTSGKHLATGTMRGGCDLWDVASGAHLGSLEGHAGEIRGIVHSPDGTRVATFSSDHTARLWDASSGEPLLTLEGHDGPVTGLAFSSDGRDLVTASSDGTLRLWTRSDREIDRARRQSPGAGDAAEATGKAAGDSPQ